MTYTKPDALISWVQNTRQQNTWLDNEADALLLFLQQLKLEQHSADAALQAPPTLGVHIPSMSTITPQLIDILADDNQRIEIVLDGTTLDYQAHILPSLIDTPMAVRFTHRRSEGEDPYILPLTLMSPSDMACHLIAHHGAFVREEAISAHLSLLEARKSPILQSHISGSEMHIIIETWQHHVSSQQPLSPALRLQAGELAPFLNREDLTQLLALFWNNDSDITFRWSQHLHILQRLNNSSQILAPARLIIETFMSPDQAFLRPLKEDKTSRDETISVCPILDGVIFSAVSLPRHTLLNACREMTLTLANSDLDLAGMDILAFAGEDLYRFNLLPTDPRDVKSSRQQQQEKWDLELQAHFYHLRHTMTFTVNEAEELLRALQARSDRHGELLNELAITEQALETIIIQSDQEGESTVLPFIINLLDDDDSSLILDKDKSNFATSVYRHWINHIRKKGFDTELAQRCGLTPQQLQMLCHILIQTSYKTGLQTHLANMIDDFKDHPIASVCCSCRILNEFITWLGYDRVTPDMRPESRIHRGTTLFNSPRKTLHDTSLIDLDHQVHSNIAWLGDWLIALYCRTLEPHVEYDLNTAQRHELNALF